MCGKEIKQKRKEKRKKNKKIEGKEKILIDEGKGRKRLHHNITKDIIKGKKFGGG